MNTSFVGEFQVRQVLVYGGRQRRTRVDQTHLKCQLDKGFTTMAYDLVHVFKRLGVVPSNVILVGAWEGQEIKSFLEAGIQRAYLFEAEPIAINVLTKSYGDDKRVLLFQGAVASKDGQVKKFHILNHGSSSLLAPNLDKLRVILPDFQIENEILVNTITLDTCLRDHWNQWNENKLNTLLIVDIQGGELEALKGGKELLKRVGWIHSEVSTTEIYQNQNTLTELDQFLSESGFKRVSTRIYSERSHGDALYFRPNLITYFFQIAMKIGDLHWNLARKRPEWIPSLSHFGVGKSMFCSSRS